MSFHRGQKVVCVNTGRAWKSLRDRLEHAWEKFWHPYTEPKVGSIYTVANVYTAAGDLYLELVELTDCDPEVWEPGFYSAMFRPVVERKTDIGVFTTMLDGVKRREPA